MCLFSKFLKAFFSLLFIVLDPCAKFGFCYGVHDCAHLQVYYFQCSACESQVSFWDNKVGRSYQIMHSDVIDLCIYLYIYCIFMPQTSQAQQTLDTVSAGEVVAEKK